MSMNQKTEGLQFTMAIYVQHVIGNPDGEISPWTTLFFVFVELLQHLIHRLFIECVPFFLGRFVYLSAPKFCDTLNLHH